MDGLEGRARQAIEVQLPSDMIELFDIEVKTQVIASRFGSLTIFFSAVIASYTLIGGYKQFYDSVQLIKSQSNRLLQTILDDTDPDLRLCVAVEYPRLMDPYEPWHHHKLGYREAESLYPWRHRAPQRDAFFWFLLCFNVILTGGVALLVWKAVQAIYF